MSRDYGPTIVASILGTCVSSYIDHGVTRDEMLELVGEIYDGIIKTMAAHGIEPGGAQRRVDAALAALRDGAAAAPDDRAEAIEYMVVLCEQVVRSVL